MAKCTQLLSSISVPSPELPPVPPGSSPSLQDPMEVVNKHGADALRLYLINSPVVRRRYAPLRGAAPSFTSAGL